MDPLDLLSDVVRTERTSLAAIARREGLSQEDAVDCVQDALCTFLRLALDGELDARAGHGALLAGIVRNAARNKRRRHHVARPHEPVTESVESGVDDAEAMLARAEDHVRLHACVARLCDTQRAVVTLRLLEERDGEDVAAALGIARGYVDVLLHRARKSLLVCLTE